MSEIQRLVASVRGDAGIQQMTDEVDSISGVAGSIMAEAQRAGFGEQTVRLGDCRARLMDALQRGRVLGGRGVGHGDGDWRMWAQTLPPIAFELARETKELVQRVGSAAGHGADDFS